MIPADEQYEEEAIITGTQNSTGTACELIQVKPIEGMIYMLGKGKLPTGITVNASRSLMT
jgi:hypothetical protein